MSVNVTVNIIDPEVAAEAREILGLWEQSYDSGDPIHNAAIIELARSKQVSEILNTEKNRVKRGTDELKKYNDTSTHIIELQPKGEKTDIVLGTKPPDFVVNQAAIDLANLLIDGLHGAGLALDLRPADSSGKEVPFTSGDQLKPITKEQFKDWADQLQKKSENITTTATQDQITLQNILGIYNKSVEGASAYTKKLADLLDSIVRNFKNS